MTRSLRVAFVDHSTAPGGAELALVRVLAHTPTDVRAVVFVPRAGKGVFGDRAWLSCIETGPIQSPGAAASGSLRNLLRHSVGVAVQVYVLFTNREFRLADVVVANTSRAAVYATLAGRLQRKPVVIHLRDEVLPRSLGQVGFRAMCRVLKWASAIVANSAHTLGVASPYLPPGVPCHVIQSPVGVRAQAVAQVRDDPVRRVGMVARIDPWKGHTLLLNAFAIAFGAGDVQLHIAGAPIFGQDFHLNSLRELARRLGIADRVHFEGHVSDVEAFIDSMDICIQCSLRPEPLGQNVLQYLARRRPVVVSDRGGPSEWVDGNNGLTFAQGDVNGLADAMRRIADDADLRGSMARAPRASVLSDEEVALSLFAAIRPVAAAARRRHSGLFRAKRRGGTAPQKPGAAE